jgi:hypothetical protein
VFSRLWQRKREQRPIIIVSGLPRSGTSLMMQMLAAGGVPLLTDHKRQPDVSNPRGYYEYEPVKRLPAGEVDWLMQAQGQAVKVVSPLLPHLPPTHEYAILFMERAVDEVRQSQQRMMAQQGTSAHAIPDYNTHLNAVKRWLSWQMNCRYLFIQHHQAIYTPQAVVAQVTAFLSAWTLDDMAMVQVADPQLHRAK